ncbi:hypothetical protein [Cohnella sp. REN36]|uniref:hypothetical protein n=1 Tax=Cohnella sp. REN36 TaxID=2887347 RepID=UPI001D157218|nr:hypothetical protein [Cohnella sp. REN36]MCC3376124.1 hypothetical protein [Cohnella sp. REN36]
MKKAMFRATLAAATLIAALSLPAAAGAAVPVTKLDTEGDFAALQVGNRVFVHDAKSQLFQTNGVNHDGKLIDLFTLPYGPETIPMIVVSNEKNGFLVFSDLWPEFAKGKEKNTTEEYMSGRITAKPIEKIANRTNHNYAVQKGDTVHVFTANDFKDLKKGYHESYTVKGTLRGLILYDCCPYAVVEGEDGGLDVYHAGEKGPVKAGHIDM